MNQFDHRDLPRRAVLAGLGATGFGLAGFAGRAVARSGVVPITPDAVHVLEGGRRHDLAETVFEVLGDYKGNRTGFEIGEGAVIDVLRIRVAPGVTQVDRFLRVGAGARIGRLDVAAATQTAPHDDPLDGFVQIRDNDVEIGEARFRNIDRCVMIFRAAGVRIASFECESYSKGLKVDQARDLRVDRLRARIASPHAVPHPGYNALTISDSENLSFPEIEAEDSAEHGVYLGGGAGELGSRDVRFGRVITRRTGQCGFKCKASKTPSEGVSIDRLDVTDATFGSKAGRNEDGLRVENCFDVRVGELETRCEQIKRSCYAGLYLNGVTQFTLEGGHVRCPAGPMVLIEDSRKRPNAGLRISGLSGSDLKADGYFLRHEHGQALIDLQVERSRLDGVAGAALRIAPGTVIAPGPSLIDIEAADIAGPLVRGGPRSGDPRLQVRLAEG